MNPQKQNEVGLPLHLEQQPNINKNHQFPSLGREGSIYSLTLGDFYHTLWESDKDFLSMKMDELINSICCAEENQVLNSNNRNDNSMISLSAIGKQPSLPRQGSLTLPAPLCKKTVAEVWSEIQRRQQQLQQQSNNYNYGSVTNNYNAQSTQSARREPPFAQMTLEEFLIKAGVVREQCTIAMSVQASTNQDQHMQQYGFFPNNNPTMGHSFVGRPVMGIGSGGVGVGGSAGRNVVAPPYQVVAPGGGSGAIAQDFGYRAAPPPGVCFGGRVVTDHGGFPALSNMGVVTNDHGGYPALSNMGVVANDHGGYPALSNMGVVANDYGGFPAVSNMGVVANDHGGHPAMSNMGVVANDYGGYPAMSNMGVVANDHGGYPAVNMGVVANAYGGYPAMSNMGVVANYHGGYPAESNMGVVANYHGGYPAESNMGVVANNLGGYPAVNMGVVANDLGSYPAVNMGVVANDYGGYPAESNMGVVASDHGGYPVESNMGVVANDQGGYPVESNMGVVASDHGGYPVESNMGVVANDQGGYPVESNMGVVAIDQGGFPAVSNMGVAASDHGGYPTDSKMGVVASDQGSYPAVSNMGVVASDQGGYPAMSSMGVVASDQTDYPAVSKRGVMGPPPPVLPEGIGTGKNSGGKFGMEMGVPSRKKRVTYLCEEKKEERRQRRMQMDRESAAKSRERKLAYYSELEVRVKQLKEEHAQLILDLTDRDRRRKEQYLEEGNERFQTKAEKAKRKLRSLRRSRSCSL